jgi:hypothetical protein
MEYNAILAGESRMGLCGGLGNQRLDASRVGE